MERSFAWPPVSAGSSKTTSAIPAPRQTCTSSLSPTSCSDRPLNSPYIYIRLLRRYRYLPNIIYAIRRMERTIRQLFAEARLVRCRKLSPSHHSYRAERQDKASTVIQSGRRPSCDLSVSRSLRNVIVRLAPYDPRPSQEYVVRRTSPISRCETRRPLHPRRERTCRYVIPRVREAYCACSTWQPVRDAAHSGVTDVI
jgi:hypothetical protein